jgi:dihydroorotate dehydrogenase
MKRFLINPPFGNYVEVAGCKRVMGSYTLHRRGGLIMQVAKTLRPIKGGWTNKIGLRNKGIKHVRFQSGRIYSIVGLEADDWEVMLPILSTQTDVPFLHLELNLGCPNVHEYGIDRHTLEHYCHWHAVSVKLPATDAIDEVADMAVQSGANQLHCSNTLPTPAGGESGRRLKEWNLPVVERLAKRYPSIPIIAGGGIYSAQDVKDYENAGASHFGLSTVWFTPWRVPAILKA